MAAGLMAEIIEAPDKLAEMEGDHVPHGQLELCDIEEEDEDDDVAAYPPPVAMGARRRFRL